MRIIWILTVLIISLLSIFLGAKIFQFNVVQEPIIFKGNVDIRTVNVSFRVGGRLKSLSVNEGTLVKKGDVLGTLDDAMYQIQLKEAQAALNIQNSRLQLLLKGTRVEELSQKAEQLKIAKAQVTNAFAMLKRQEKLANSGAARDTNLDDATFSFQSAESALKIAEHAFLLAQKPYQDEEIMQIKAQVDQAEASVEKIKLYIEDTKLIAPSNGVILTRVIEPGTMVNPGAPIFTVSLTKPTWVRAYVNEPKLGYVEVGSKVYVYTDSRERPYVGTIGFVSPNAEFTPKNIETTELRTTLVYRFRVIIDEPDRKLRQGMPVTVSLITKLSSKPIDEQASIIGKADPILLNSHRE